jgi:hypothetical protein
MIVVIMITFIEKTCAWFLFFLIPFILIPTSSHAHPHILDSSLRYYPFEYFRAVLSVLACIKAAKTTAEPPWKPEYLQRSVPLSKAFFLIVFSFAPFF